MSYWMPSDSQWVEDLFPLMSYWMPTAKIGMLTTKKKVLDSDHLRMDPWNGCIVLYSAGLGTIILMFGFWEIQSINLFHKSKPEAFRNPRNLEQRMSFSQPTHSLSQLISFSRSYSIAIQENPLSHVIFQRFDSFGLLKKGLVFKGTTQFSGDAWDLG